MSDEFGGGASPSLSDTQREVEQVVSVGQVHLNKTHPNLYRAVMTHAVVSVALGVNFWVFTPTYQVFGMPNYVWGSVFLLLGVAELVFLNVCRRLRLVRVAMASSVGFLLFMAVGTSQPFLEGVGSLQLPLLYLGMAALLVPLLLEPFINPWTARRADQ